jgi:hypothetical protein
MRRSVEIFKESATGCANVVQTAETAGKDLKNTTGSADASRRVLAPFPSDPF